MFLGTAIHTLDEKGRVVMPSAYRAELKDGLVATPGKEGGIAVIPKATFTEFADRAMADPPTLATRRRARAMFTSAETLKLDSQGRILLSQELRKHAGLEDAHEVVIAGVYKSIEIWHPDSFIDDLAVSTSEYLADEEVPGY